MTNYRGTHVQNKPRRAQNTRDFKIQRRDSKGERRWKVNLRSFSLYRDYFYLLTLSNVGEPSWSWIPCKEPYPSSEREIKFRRCLFTFSTKRVISHFHVVVVQKRQRIVQKSVMRVQSCRLLIKPTVFLLLLLFVCLFFALFCFVFFFWRTRCGPVVES